MTDFPLIKYVSKTKKPVIISTGMANIKQIVKTYKFAKKCRIKDLTLLYCVSSYPAKPYEFNLSNLFEFSKKFKCRIGFSDHSTNNIISASAVSMGADVVEKHITLRNNRKAYDRIFSLKDKEVGAFRKDIDLAYLLRGKNNHVKKKKHENLVFKRSIFCVSDISKGERFTTQNIKRIRPGYGLEASRFANLIGTKSKKNIKRGEPIRENDF